MKKLYAFALGSAILLAASGCGQADKAASTDGGASAAPEAATKLTLAATNWKFDKEVYNIKAGEPITISLDNQQGIHGVELEGLNAKLDNKKKSVTITPKAGTYTIRCNVSCGTGHSSMTAKLIVE